jgi:hypothetical protein
VATVMRFNSEWSEDKDVVIDGEMLWFKCHSCGERVGQLWDDFKEIQEKPYPQGLYCFTCYLSKGKAKVNRIVL